MPLMPSCSCERVLVSMRFWTKDIHAYVDNKAFPLPLTPEQRKRFAQTRVSGHLRLKNEGTLRGFTKPREKHQWLGMPSVI